MTQYVYRVTRIVRDPDYWENAMSTRICTKRSLSGQIKAWKERSDRRILKVERAPIGEFEDVTEEVLGADN